MSSHNTDNNESAGSNNNTLKFLPFISNVDISFWLRYCKEKLNTIKLSTEPIKLVGTYNVTSNHHSSNNVEQQSQSSTTTIQHSQQPTLQIHESSLLLNDENIITTMANNNNNNNIELDDDVQMYGELIGYNTKESFKNVNKNELLRNWFNTKFFKNNSSPNNVDAASLTSLFLVITYADLKNHSVVYWFGFPAIIPITGSLQSNSPQQFLKDLWTYEQCMQLSKNIHTMRVSLLSTNNSSTSSTGSSCPPYFIATRTKCLVLTADNYKALKQESDKEGDGDLYFGFFDPTTTSKEASEEPIGWPMRNLVAYMSFYLNLGGKSVNMISYRPTKRSTRRKKEQKQQQQEQQQDNDDIDDDDTINNNDHPTSLLLNITIPSKEDYGVVGEGGGSDLNIDSSSFEIDTTSGQLVRRISSSDGEEQIQEEAVIPGINNKVLGWELDGQKMKPKRCKLRHLLDEKCLSVQATDLNLKLMKWRMIPSLDIEMLSKQKVLIIGAGTLGCSVSRTLLGWGIRHIKFVDYGYVSYSNPVRQFLFELNDCKDDSSGNNNNGRSKAEAAADALHKIVADAHTEGITMSVPMPGHVMAKTDEEISKLKEDVDKLDELVQECDVIFLLTDTRESRWLPTVMANAHNKVLINSAMGLDTWLVMRHGGCSNSSDNASSSDDQSQQQNQRLGCYYCTDVHAPQNSMKNRTLDQQCTVTRPGLSPIASSMAVELFISLLHHPQKQYAPAPKPPTISSSNNSTGAAAAFSPTINDDASAATPMGIIPHQIRGSIVTYTMMTPTVPAFQYCTGCSIPVIDAYKEDKYNLIMNACTSSTCGKTYLENLSGWTKFKSDDQSKLDDLILDNDDDW